MGLVYHGAARPGRYDEAPVTSSDAPAQKFLESRDSCSRPGAPQGLVLSIDHAVGFDIDPPAALLGEQEDAYSVAEELTMWRLDWSFVM